MHLLAGKTYNHVLCVVVLFWGIISVMAISDFLVNTDYPLDKVVYMNSGSFSSASGSSTAIEVPHGLSYRPLLIGTWSLTPDFSVSYEQGSSGFVSLSVPQLTIQSTPNTIRLVPFNNTGSTITYYWRVFGFMPSDVNINTGFTASIADVFTFSSDYNYSKLLTQGTLSWSMGIQIVTHGLGYRPQIEVWYEQPMNSNYLTKWYLGFDSTFTAFDSIEVTNQEVIFRFGDVGGVPGIKYYYRIYADTGVAI